MFLLLLFLAVVGSIALFLMIIDSLWSFLELVSSYLMPYFLPAEVQPLSKRFGSWAVITGGTDGIGKQYALELAARGLNIAIISRNPDKLKAVAAEIEKQHSVKTKVVVADFSKGSEVFPHIEEELKDIPVGILVNNVGVQFEYPMPICDTPPSTPWELINVNVGAVTAMSRMILPGMVQRGRGAVVNVSSGAELQPLPLMSVYAATKAYVRSFTLAIREEYAPKGIYIQHLSPLYISTKINAFSETIMKGNFLVPNVETYARHAVATLGRQHHTTGYWVHGIQYFFMSIAPVWLNMKIGGHLNEQMRQEYLRNAKIKNN